MPVGVLRPFVGGVYRMNGSDEVGGGGDGDGVGVAEVVRKPPMPIAAVVVETLPVAAAELLLAAAVVADSVR